MRHLILTFLLIAVSVVAAPASAGDSSYRDPRQPSFTVLIPHGWTAARTNEGVQLAVGTSWANLAVLSSAVQPGAMLVQIRSQFERQWKNFREVDSGGVVFGGQKGAYATYAGIPPSGVGGITKVVTMTNGRLTYTLFMGAHADEYGRVRPEMDRIQASFAPEPAR
jgi:hypothetical protein